MDLTHSLIVALCESTRTIPIYSEICYDEIWMMPAVFWVVEFHRWRGYFLFRFFRSFSLSKSSGDFRGLSIGQNIAIGLGIFTGRFLGNIGNDAIMRVMNIERIVMESAHSIWLFLRTETPILNTKDRE